MIQHTETTFLHNHPGAYWCPHCWKFTLDCAHLVEPLDAPVKKLHHFQYLEVTWARRILQITMNTGERYQFFGVSRSLAVKFVREPDEGLLKGYRFERVRGRTGNFPARG